MDNLKSFFKKYPVFLLMLPVFFVLHGYRENYDFVPVKDALLLTGVYILSSVVMLMIFRLFYKNWLKAALLSFFLMAFHFFFGSIQDFLRKIFPGSFISKYIFILPVALCLLIAVIIFLKKRKKPLHYVSLYLNFLLVLLILLDAVLLAGNIISSRKKESLTLPKEFAPCADCSKPDVYIIIADEYAGNRELKDILRFDNSAFLDQLARRNFHIIPNSSSNYNFTPYSIASILDMDYFDLKGPTDQPQLARAYQTIRDNKFLQFLQHHQYKFYNYSLFDFKGHPASTIETFLPVKTKLITSQTFLDRFEKEMRFHLIDDLKWQKEINKVVYADRNNNENLLRLTHQATSEKTAAPKFVLTHLMMPHYPYYYDKNGDEFPFDKIIEGNQTNQQNYIEYLQYSNKKLLELVDDILKNSTSPPVIILMGDHGFRHFTTSVDARYHLCNLVSVYLPDNNYSSFSDSLTNVNLLRTVLNTSFKQQLPYLKDSSIIMDNP